jgi:hypothetical protein
VKIPRLHKKVAIPIEFGWAERELPVDQFFAVLKERIEDSYPTEFELLNPHIVLLHEIDYDYHDFELCLIGYRPMTSKEKAYALRQAKTAKDKGARKREKQEEAERAELRKLIKKYPDAIEFVRGKNGIEPVKEQS